MVSRIAADVAGICEEIQSAAQSQDEDIERLVQEFFLRPTTPEATYEFEKALEDRLRETGRRIAEVVYNRIEADNAEEMPKRVESDGQEYSRKNEKTNNRNGLGTLFGKIALSRFSYEPLSEARDDGQPSFSPLEMSLGIVAGNATPALAERVGRTAAEHTQGEVLELLQCNHGVKWSPQVLRGVVAAVSNGIAEHLHETQKLRLLDWLRQADCSKGRRKITLAAGRDGGHRP